MARTWEGYGRDTRDRGYQQYRGERDRDWSERAGDEVRSWLGDDEAERRRMADDMRGGDRDYGRDDRRSNSNDRDYGYGGYAGRGFGVGGFYAGGGPRYGENDGDYNRSFRGGDRYFGGDYRGRYDYGQERGYTDRDYRGRDRGFMERAGDEVASWFGDEDAERRRQMDAGHRGRGPKNYTRSDDRIRDDVNDRLSDDPHIDASDVEITVSDGEVTLNGTVNERFAKRHAEDIAESVSGVKHVQNNLRMNTQAGLNRGVRSTSTGQIDKSGEVTGTMANRH